MTTVSEVVNAAQVSEGASAILTNLQGLASTGSQMAIDQANKVQNSFQEGTLSATITNDVKNAATSVLQGVSASFLNQFNWSSDKNESKPVLETWEFSTP